MDVKSQPLNIPGHPYYDEKVPVKQITEVVGSNLVIKAGKDQYCGEGYYSLVFDGKKVDAGTIYMRYSLTETAVP